MAFISLARACANSITSMPRAVRNLASPSVRA
jgi:hypothetical protein